MRGVTKLLRVAATVLALPMVAQAAGDGGWHMQPISPNQADKPSLQRGAALYMNYCLGCHSLKYQRYERTADDLEIPHDIMLENLIFTGQKIGELIEIPMPRESAKQWFGAPPPDLTMVTRVRSPEWVYNYLKTFYIDESRPFGVNNKVFDNVGMPNVLIELQGVQRESGDGLLVDEGTGQLTEQEFDKAVYDLVNFLHYIAEPSRADRYRIGIYVILFLVILYVFTYLLGREYQKEVH
jgi:cytochrome c1